MDRSRVAIVIPALNEASTIGHIVHLAGVHGVPWVVDDGSLDATVQIARDAGALVVSHPQTQRYDQALNSGFAAAYSKGCDVFVTLSEGFQSIRTRSSSLDTSKVQRPRGILPSRTQIFGQEPFPSHPAQTSTLLSTKRTLPEHEMAKYR